MVVSAISKAEGKLFRAEGLVFASPERLFSFLYDRFDDYPQWTSIWSSCKVGWARAAGALQFLVAFASRSLTMSGLFTQTLRRIDRHTDMVYMAMTEKGTVGLFEKLFWPSLELRFFFKRHNVSGSLPRHSISLVTTFTLPIPSIFLFIMQVSRRDLSVVRQWCKNDGNFTIAYSSVKSVFMAAGA